MVNVKQLKLDIFLPKNYSVSNDKHAVFVVYHGDSCRTGEASWHYPDCAY